MSLPNKQKGVLYVVSAPSGCGKGTILEQVFKNEENLFFSVSATTRNPRPGEENGVNYFFMTVEEFQQMIKEDAVFEYAQFCGNYYGTPKKAVFDKLENGYDVILEIETNGALQVKKSYPDAVLIFILPPSVAELKRRLNKRGTETDEIIEKRVNEAVGEIHKAYEYDYVMVNGDLEKAILDFTHIIRSEKLRITNNNKIINEVLENA